MTGVFGELAKVGSQYVASGSHATSRVEPSVDGVDGVDEVDPFGRNMHHKVAWWSLPSGKHSQFANLKMAHRNSWFTHYKWWFSIAMLNYPRVNIMTFPEFAWFFLWFPGVLEETSGCGDVPDSGCDTEPRFATICREGWRSVVESRWYGQHVRSPKWRLCAIQGHIIHIIQFHKHEYLPYCPGKWIDPILDKKGVLRRYLVVGWWDWSWWWWWLWLLLLLWWRVFITPNNFSSEVIGFLHHTEKFSTRWQGPDIVRAILTLEDSFRARPGHQREFDHHRCGKLTSEKSPKMWNFDELRWIITKEFFHEYISPDGISPDKYPTSLFIKSIEIPIEIHPWKIWASSPGDARGFFHSPILMIGT